MPAWREYKGVLRYLWVLVIVAAALHGTAGLAPCGDCHGWGLDYAVLDESSGAPVGEVVLEITERPGRFRWHEVRTYGTESDMFDVVFDPDTLRPTDYVRRIHSEKGDQVIRIDVEDGRVTATAENRKGVSTHRVTLPSGEVVIEPLFKYYLSRVCDRPAQAGRVTLVAWMGNEIKTFPLKWRQEGKEVIAVPAGETECFRLWVSPASWYVRLLSKGQPVWLDTSHGHAVVRSPVRRSLFAEERLMVLTNRRVTDCNSPTP